MKLLPVLVFSLLCPLCVRAGLVTLAWDVNNPQGTVSYTLVYWQYHTSQYQYVTVQTESVTLDLPDDQTFCAYVFAKNSSGQTGVPSDTIFF